MARRILYFMIFTLCCVWPSLSLASNAELSSLINNKNPVKAYLKDFANQSGQSQIIPEEYKKILESALLNRKAVKFEIVKSPELSDVQISGVIKKYQYLERGPMKVSPGAGTMLLDMAATATHNYVEMEVEFTITDTKTNKALWKDTVSAYIKKVMTPEESVPLIYDKISRNFLWKSFGKPNS